MDNKEAADVLEGIQMNIPGSDEYMFDVYGRAVAALRGQESPVRVPDITEIRGAVARGWCAPETSDREMDTDLAEAISQEVLRLNAIAPERRG